MYDYEISENLQEVMIKLSKKDKSLYEQLLKRLKKLLILIT